MGARGLTGEEAGSLDVLILGPLVVSRAGKPTDLGTRKQRAVLAMLALEAGQVVSLDRIISGLWADEAPSSATGTLQAYISQLRRVLEPDRAPRSMPRILVTREPGYLLAVRPDQVDAVRFSDAVVRARAALEAGAFADAERTLTAALAQWRGDPLLEFTDEAFAKPAISRLTMLRLDAIEDLVDAQLALGRHARVAEQARGVLQQEPFRERSWAALMLALYRDGRQADALAAYRDAREILDEQLGLPPGPSLQALERSILRQDPQLRVPPVPQPVRVAVATEATPVSARTTPAAPAEPPRILGRAPQLAYVAERIHAARSGHGGLLLVSGRAGVGKTSFATQAVDRAAHDGMTVAWSRCVEGSATPAFWPWIQILRAVGPDGGTAGLLEALTGRAQSPERGADPDAARFHLHEAVGEVLRTVAGTNPLLAVIDDIHLADAASLRLLAHVAGDLSRLPVLVVATMRSEPGEVEPALRETLGALANEGGVERLSLQPFTVADVRDYLRAEAGVGVDGDVVAALHERTGGNPFYLRELLRLLASEHPAGWGRTEVVAESAVPETVRDVIGRRVARMPEDTQALLRAAAVIGRDVDTLLLETAAGLENERVLSLLEPAVATGLLVEVAGTWNYRFAHALVRDALYAELSRLQRARIHRRVGEALETLDVVDDPATPGLLAHHFGAAARIGAAEQAIHYGQRAARLAETQLAYDEAVGFLSTALTAIEPTAPNAVRRRCELLVDLGRAQRLAGDVVAARVALDEAVSLGTRLGDDSLVIDAATVFGGVTHWNWRAYGQVDEAMIAILEDQVARLDPADHTRRAALLGTLGVELYYGERRAEGERYALEAVELARRYGDVELRTRTLNNYCVASWIADRNEPRLAATNEILSLGPLPRRVEVISRLHRMMLLLARGDLAAYDLDLARCRSLVAEIRTPELAAQVTYAAAGRTILDGQWAEGERLVEAASSAQRLTSMWGAQWIRLVLLYTSRRFQDRPGELLDELVAQAEHPELALLRPTAVLCACESGDEATARALVEKWGSATRLDWSWDIAMFQWGLIAARLGTPDPAVLYDTLAPYADNFVCVGSAGASWGVNHYVLAALAARLGRGERAAGHAAAALAAHQRLGAEHLVTASRRQLAALARAPHVMP